MKRSEWEAIPENQRNAAVCVCQNLGIDLEKECIKIEIEDGKTVSPWMTRAEAATYCRVSTDTIDNWCAAGAIKRAKLGAGRPGSVLIDRDSLETFLRGKIVARKKRVRKTASSVVGGYRVQHHD